jgi:hypothetical protein
MSKSTIVKWAVLSIIGLVGLSIVASFAISIGSVLTSPSRVVSRTLQTDNIVTNYEWFHQAHANYQGRIRQIGAHRKLVETAAGNPGETSRLTMELAAMQQSCRELANTYNARATMTNRSIFMGREAPETLNPLACE